MAKREYDVVVWGATGFTGKWVAKHLFEHYPQSQLRWAIAGRNPDKLDDVREFIGDTDASVQGILADSDDQESLQDMVASTKVIISTVGPYAYYGSLLVQVCATEGTHYVDLTGEVPWMRAMIDAHSKSAHRSGARIVHSCGFDSIPSDMGTYFTQQQALLQFGEYLKSLRFALLKARGGISGGTVHSMLNIVQQAVTDKAVRRLLQNPYSLNPDPSFRGPDGGDQRSAKFSEELKAWTAPFIMASINTRIVRRTNAVLGFVWGKDFQYSETLVTAKGAKGYAIAMGIAAGFIAFGAVALTGLGRKLLGVALPSQGEGPKVDPENPGFYTIDFHGETASGKKIHTRVTGDGDPGYGSTAKMLAESAVCLALDDDQIAVEGGFWTPASAMGEPLLARLQAQGGLTFTVHSD